MRFPLANLDEIAEIQGGIQKQPKRIPAHNTFPFLRVANVMPHGLDLGEVHTIELFDGELERYRLERGDLLVVEGNGSASQIGRAALWDGSIEDAVHQNHLIRVRPGHLVNERFLGYMWSSPNIRSELTRVASSTSGLHTLSVTKLRKIRLPLPPLNEQFRIVEELDDRLSRIDAAEAILRASQTRLDVLIGAVLGECRDGELRPLAEVAAIQGGIQKQPKRAPKDNAYPFLRVANVTARGLDLGDVHRIELFGDELNRLSLQTGDLLVVEGNGSPSQIGRACMWDGSIGNCVHQNHLIRVRPSQDLDPRYLEAVWNSPENRSNLSNVASSSSGLHTLSVSKLKRISIPVPPRSRQAELIARVDQYREAENRLAGSIVISRSRTAALRRSLLRAAFNGELVDQDPNDEPADVALARIREQPKPIRKRAASTKT